MFEAMV
jgi:hypothetical protein